MTLVKICGVTRIEDAEMAANEGADFLGLNFWPGSKRRVSPDVAAGLAVAARTVSQTVHLVGLFVDQSEGEITGIASALALDFVQLHGDEPPSLVAALTTRGFRVWKAHAVSTAWDLEGLVQWPADAHVLDAPSPGRGGSGQRFDWAHATAAVTAGHRIVLAGGLTPDNVADAVRTVRPWAVDVASGVESLPGIKDPAKVRAFLAAARTR
ncbi:MAG TPA: phosphoribosylanthranilate isomerase [Kofleriaceae bacterium]|nr:phosphoribosylanthranilate isomerase [Kofleriaceae bacterium]